MSKVIEQDKALAANIVNFISEHASWDSYIDEPTLMVFLVPLLNEYHQAAYQEGYRKGREDIHKAVQDLTTCERSYPTAEGIKREYSIPAKAFDVLLTAPTEDK